MNDERISETVTAWVGEAVTVQDDRSVVIDKPDALREGIESLVQTAVLGSETNRGLAQWLIRACAQEMGIIPASIHDLYFARGRGETRNDYTVPAINLRALPFYAARAVFRALDEIDAKALIFEIARSEMGYTDQSPAEYTANLLAAAIAEGYQGPVFIQGDHFQVSPKRFVQTPDEEMETLRSLIRSAISGGFFNIDIDTSTLVDLSQETIPEQQRTNFTLCAELATLVREFEPKGVTISIGGEIGEVGGHNSTEAELRAFMQGFNQTLDAQVPGAPGLSKISIQTGTSHGGVVLPDGTIAEVKVDFDTLERLSNLARVEFGMAGAVQHGASTLPISAFSRFAEAGTCEVHLATNFQNILYDHLPDAIRQEIYSFLDTHFDHERKPDQTEEQFYYKTRKRALGPFKNQLWDLPEGLRQEIETSWEKQFRILFERLNIQATQDEVERHIKPVAAAPILSDYVKGMQASDDVDDLAD
ncbi:MAG TPA: aldolase [Anaerolineae bacterium]|nr:aldolase [Anaerolineae bacterium]